MSISTPDIQYANLIVIIIDGGAAPTVLILTRYNTTSFYGGGGEMTASASQVLSCSLKHTNNTVTEIKVRSSAEINRTIKAIYKIY